jgi:hypothetical protein
MDAAATNDTEDTSWVEGEVLVVDATVGDIGPETDGAIDPAGGLHYIAAAGSADLIQQYNATSGSPANVRVPVFDFYGGGEFMTQNVTDTDDTQLGPAAGPAGGSGAMTGVLVGVTADLWCDDSAALHHFSLDINGDFFVITKILDVNNEDILISGGTADKIIFRRNI